MVNGNKNSRCGHDGCKNQRKKYCHKHKAILCKKHWGLHHDECDSDDIMTSKELIEDAQVLESMINLIHKYGELYPSIKDLVEEFENQAEMFGTELSHIKEDVKSVIDEDDFLQFTALDSRILQHKKNLEESPFYLGCTKFVVKKELEKEMGIDPYSHPCSNHLRPSNQPSSEAERALQNLKETHHRACRDHEAEVARLCNTLRERDIQISEGRVAVRELREEISEKDEEMERQSEELRRMSEEIEANKEEIEIKDGEIEDKDKDIQRKDREIQKKNGEMKRKGDEIRKMCEDNLKKDEKIRKLKEELKRRDDKLKEKNEELKIKNTELEDKNKELKGKDQEIQSKKEELEIKSEEIEGKDEEIQELAEGKELFLRCES